MVALASDRESWKQLVDDVVEKHVEKNEKKPERKRQSRRLKTSLNNIHLPEIKTKTANGSV